MSRFRLVAKRPSLSQRLIALPRQVRAAGRAYAVTPRPLRRPGRAVAAALVLVSVWFAGLFTALGWRAAPTSTWMAAGYFTAAALGVSSLPLLLTRRPRAAAGSTVSMLVVGQVVAVAPLIVALAS